MLKKGNTLTLISILEFLKGSPISKWCCMAVVSPCFTVFNLIVFGRTESSVVV